MLMLLTGRIRNRLVRTKVVILRSPVPTGPGLRTDQQLEVAHDNGPESLSAGTGLVEVVV